MIEATTATVLSRVTTVNGRRWRLISSLAYVRTVVGVPTGRVAADSGAAGS